MIMAACFNGQERDRASFRRLLSCADERFVLEGFSQPKGSTMTLGEVGWKDDRCGYQKSSGLAESRLNERAADICWLDLGFESEPEPKGQHELSELDLDDAEKL